MAKRKWSTLEYSDKVAAVLSAVRRGRSSKSLADYLDAPPHELEAILVQQREDGFVRCTNKVWYRADQPLVPPAPKAPRLTAKQELFLKRQGNLF